MGAERKLNRRDTGVRLRKPQPAIDERTALLYIASFGNLLIKQLLDRCAEADVSLSDELLADAAMHIEACDSLPL